MNKLTLCCRLIFCSVPASFSRLNSDSLRMSSAFKSTICEDSRIHDNQIHAYGHVYGRWETKQRITLIPKLRSDRKLFSPPFCSCLCFRCLVRCILVGSTDSFLVPGSREKYETATPLKQKNKTSFNIPYIILFYPFAYFFIALP